MSSQQHSKLLKLSSKIKRASNSAALKAAFRSMEETVQQERNNLKKKTRILQYQDLDIQPDESVLCNGWLPCVYSTIFITLGHQSVYWLPKHAIKNVLSFSPLDAQLRSPLHLPSLGRSVLACSKAQNPARHEPALPTDWSCLKPQARVLQHLFIYVYKYLKGGCEEAGQRQALLSGAQWQGHREWTQTETRVCLNIRKHFFTARMPEHWYRLPREAVESPS